MLDKSVTPNEIAIEQWLGLQGYRRLEAMERRLMVCYALAKDLRFPFGNQYGWGYKYGHKSSHLCYVFFERDAFTVTLQIGDKAAEKVETVLQSLLLKTQKLWQNRYPCGERGGWVHYRVLANEELNDVFELLFMRKKPVRV